MERWRFRVGKPNQPNQYSYAVVHKPALPQDSWNATFVAYHSLLWLGMRSKAKNLGWVSGIMGFVPIDECFASLMKELWFLWNIEGTFLFANPCLLGVISYLPVNHVLVWVFSVCTLHLPTVKYRRRTSRGAVTASNSCPPVFSIIFLSRKPVGNTTG